MLGQNFIRQAFSTRSVASCLGHTRNYSMGFLHRSFLWRNRMPHIKLFNNLQETRQVDTRVRTSPFVAFREFSSAKKSFGRDIIRTAPISFSQQLAIDLSRINAIQILFPIEITGNLDREAYKKAWEVLLRQHEIFRTTFNEAENLQIVHSKLDVPFAEHDLTGYSEKDITIKMNQLITDDKLKPFDLIEGPLYRMAFIRLAADKTVFCFCVHHSIMDAHTMNFLFPVAHTLYQQIQEGRPISICSPKYQYSDFSRWQQQRYKAGLYAKTLEYWKQQLITANQVELFPLDHDIPKKMQLLRTALRSQYSFEIPEMYEELSKLRQATNSTFFTVLLASYYVLIYQISGQTDITISSPASNRTQIKYDEIAGCLAMPLLYRVNFADNPTFIELVNRTRETIKRGLNHQDFPYRELFDHLESNRSEHAAPLYQSSFAFNRVDRMFSFTKEPFAKLKVASVSAGGMVLPRFARISFSVAEKDGHLVGGFVYNQDLFELSTVEQLAEDYNSLLKRIIENPDQTIKELISEKEQNSEIDDSQDSILTKRGFFADAQQEKTPEQETTESIFDVSIKHNK